MKRSASLVIDAVPKPEDETFRGPHRVQENPGPAGEGPGGPRESDPVPDRSVDGSGRIIRDSFSPSGRARGRGVGAREAVEFGG